MPDADSLESFAADLRRLRLNADQPTLSRLSTDSHISRTVISETLNGRQLPSARTVDRIVRALDGDADEWVARRDALAAATAPADGEEDPDAADDGELDERPEPPMVRRRSALILGGSLLAVGALIGGGVGFGIGNAYMASTPLAERTQIAVESGLDPAKTPCVDDAEVATASTRNDGDTLLEIIWSNKCRAGWARVTRYDEKQNGNSMSVELYPQSNPNSPDRQVASHSNVNGMYTTLLVRPGDDLLCTVAEYTIGDEKISVGEPLCI